MTIRDDKERAKENLFPIESGTKLPGKMEALIALEELYHKKNAADDPHQQKLILRTVLDLMPRSTRGEYAEDDSVAAGQFLIRFEDSLKNAF